MSLAWVQAIIALFVEIMISLTGLLTVIAILLPHKAEKGRIALEQSPRKCFWAGVGMLGLFFVLLILSNAPNPFIKLFCFVAITAMTGVMTIGGSGMALLMGRRIAEMAGTRTSFGTLISGSIAFSVAVFFPYIGWFAMAPLCILFNLGAGAIAMLPEKRTNPALVPNAWQAQTAFAGGPVLTVNTVHTLPQSAPQAQPLPYEMPELVEDRVVEDRVVENKREQGTGNS